MRPFILVLAMLSLLAPGMLHAQRADLPPVEKVNEALDNHPTVMAAAARVEVARARGDMLYKGTHEAVIAGSYIETCARVGVDRSVDS